MKHSAVRFGAFFLASVFSVAQQADAPAPPAKANEPRKAEEATPNFKFTGVADAYASWNANRPSSGLNQIHNFDVNSNSWNLGSAAFSVEHEGKRFNFRVDTGFGDMNNTIVAADPWHGANRYVQQAYIGFKPFGGKPLKIEAGKFFTPAGGEVIETYNNFNTTRSPLFVLGIPYYHLGVRAVAPITKEWTGSIYVVNGWNNVYDNNSGKTFGATAAWTGKKSTLTLVYFGGPEKTGTTQGVRNLVDVVYGYTGKPWWNNYTEILWGGEDRVANASSAPGRDIWYGVAHATRFNVSKNWSLSPRVSWFMDRNGFASGMPQRLIEMTGTVEYRLSKWVIVRGELRRDLSNRQYFDSRDQAASTKTQDTALLGLTFLWRGSR